MDGFRLLPFCISSSVASKYCTAYQYELQRSALKLMRETEILKYFCVLILMSRLQFSNRRYLWAAKEIGKYIPAPNFGLIMISNRFEQLRENIRFNFQQNSEQTSEDSVSRWKLVYDFFYFINKHSEKHVFLSEYMCIDESVSPWYGTGESWLGVGPPTYISIDRKPRKVCEIQSSCCGRSKIICILRLVNSIED